MNSLESLCNIGKTLANRLRSVGIQTPEDLRTKGSVRAYLRVQSMTPEKLPVCYNLYSLEGAIRNKRWTDLSEEDKTSLRKRAGLLE
ncbi:MAG: TfoX/Sxy family DNA transformation protein [Leptospiraceae bacterium]|nr:TfoX/Sxy family DNA transformation protein [Leptospiraceae bacterium]